MELADRIRSTNEDEDAPYLVNQAVAFGDFLTDSARVQAADVGIELQSRKAETDKDQMTATERAHQEEFLKQLRGRSTIIRTQPYAEWMSHRSHRKLL